MIKLHNINKYYFSGGEKFWALKDVDLIINKSEFVAIMGPSGSGKSTLIKILGLLDSEFEGSYKFDDKDITEYNDIQLTAMRNEKIGFVFQDFNLVKRLTVKENLELPLLYSKKKDIKVSEKVDFLLDKINLKSKKNNFPDELSGGQQQRIAILRALVNNPQLIIADEPTGALDSKTSREIIEYFKELNDEGLTIVLITHDINVAKEANRIINIYDGYLKEAD